MAQQGPTVGVVKPGGGMSMRERSLQPSSKLSRHGSLVKALEHHTMQPNALPDVQCTMPWLEHYQRLLNAEFDWVPNHLSDESPVEGPPIPITSDMVKKAISQMKAGKAPGPSGTVVEMIRAAGDTGASMIRDLAAAIIRDGKVPSDWEQSFLVCLYKGNGDALDRGNYHGLKLTEQVMKVLERLVDGLIGQVVSVDDSQFGFVPGRGTTDAIFVIRQVQ